MVLRILQRRSGARKLSEERTLHACVDDHFWRKAVIRQNTDFISAKYGTAGSFSRTGSGVISIGELPIGRAESFKSRGSASAFGGQALHSSFDIVIAGLGRCACPHQNPFAPRPDHSQNREPKE